MGILRTDIVTHSQLGGAGGSVSMDGTDDALKTADNNSYIIGTNDFTIECWLYSTVESSSYDCWFANDNYSSAAGGLALYKKDAGWSAFLGSGGGTLFDSFGTFNFSEWQHVAFVRQSGTYRFYVNGEVLVETSSYGTYDLAANSLIVGANNYNNGYPDYEWPGYISNLRVINGRCIYGPGKIEVPKFKLRDVPGTVLLCCQSSSSATEAAVAPGALAAASAPAGSAFAPLLKEDTTDNGVVLADNTKFDTLSYMVPPGGTKAESNRGRGLIGNVGGEFANGIHYVQIHSSGNSLDFGDLANDERRESVVCSSTRGLFAGGDSPSGGSEINVIAYVTIATTSNGIDFGDLTAASGMGSGCSSQTRGVIALGYVHPTQVNTMDYVTIASAGNAADFGDSTDARRNSSSLSSPTRGIWAGGTPSYKDTIDYVTIATTGNATDFGNLATAAFATSAASSSTRGIFAGGGINASPNQFANNIIQYITIASTGNASDFGDLTAQRGNASGLSNSITAVFAGGCTDNGGSTATNTMDYVTITSLGNAADFGDTSATCLRTQGSSDSHGGID